MTLIYFLAAIAISGAAIFYLLITDEKRARVFKLRAPDNLPRRPRIAWAIALAPAVILPMLGQLSAFLSWLGAVTVLGWLFAMRSPANDGS